MKTARLSCKNGHKWSTSINPKCKDDAITHYFLGQFFETPMGKSICTECTIEPEMKQCRFRTDITCLKNESCHDCLHPRCNCKKPAIVSHTKNHKHCIKCHWHFYENKVYTKTEWANYVEQ